MRTVLGVSLLLIGLVIGVAGGFLISTGNIVPSNSVVTTTSVSMVLNLVTVTQTTTIQGETPSQSQTAILISLSKSSSIVPTTSASSSLQNITISGPVSGAFGSTPYKVTFSTGTGNEYSFPVIGEAFTGSIPSGTYTVVIYFYLSQGGGSSCNVVQPVVVESSVAIYPVSLSCS